MPVRNLDQIARCTLDAIVSSPKVAMYNVGITMNPDRRRRQYVLYSTPKAWEHMAFLAYGLTLLQAQKLENVLFDYCTKTNARSVRHRKYSPVREGNYRRSSGGRADDGQATYSVYLAWCEPN